MGLIERVLERLRKTAAAPGIGREVQAQVRGVSHRLLRIRDRPAACGIEKFKRNERHRPAHARHARPVVAHAADGARAVRTVLVVIHREVVIVHEVPAACVVDESVAIVIDPIARDLARIRPHVRRQIRVCVVDARVDHAHLHRGAARAHLPCLRRIDVRIHRARALPRVVHAPQIGKARVVRDHRRGIRDVVRLRVAHDAVQFAHLRHRIRNSV